MSRHEQPGASPAMSASLYATARSCTIDFPPSIASSAQQAPPPQKGFVRENSEAFAKGASKEAGKQTVQYVAEEGPDGLQQKAEQQLDDTRAKAQVSVRNTTIFVQKLNPPHM